MSVSATGLNPLHRSGVHTASPAPADPMSIKHAQSPPGKSLTGKKAASLLTQAFSAPSASKPINIPQQAAPVDPPIDFYVGSLRKEKVSFLAQMNAAGIDKIDHSNNAKPDTPPDDLMPALTRQASGKRETQFSQPPFDGKPLQHPRILQLKSGR